MPVAHPADEPARNVAESSVVKVLTKTSVKPVAYSVVESSVFSVAKHMYYRVLFAILLFDHDVNTWTWWCLMR